MGRPNQAARTKRERERNRQERRVEKEEKRAQRGELKKERDRLAEDGVDPDLVGIVAGPQANDHLSAD